MNREEALNQWRALEVTWHSQKILLKLETAFTQHQGVWVEAFSKSFLQICDHIVALQKAGKLPPITYMILTLLRSQVAEKEYSLRFYVTGQAWWLDPVVQEVGRHPCPEVFGYYEALGNLLEQERKKYIGKTIKEDVEVVLQEELQKFLQYLGRIAKADILDLTEHESFRRILKGEKIEIQVGEYLDFVELIYQERQIPLSKKEQEEVDRQLRHKKQEVLCFEDLKGMVLKGEDLRGSDLRFTDLRKSELEGINLSYSLLIGTLFKGSTLKEANLSYSLINEGNFQSCDLRGAKFRKVEGYKGLEDEKVWDTVGYYGVNFKEANLEGADFTGSNLRGADFTRSILKGVRFIACDLSYANFTGSDLSSVDFTDSILEEAIFC